MTAYTLAKVQPYPNNTELTGHADREIRRRRRRTLLLCALSEPGLHCEDYRNPGCH